MVPDTGEGVCFRPTVGVFRRSNDISVGTLQTIPKSKPGGGIACETHSVRRSWWMALTLLRFAVWRSIASIAVVPSSAAGTAFTPPHAHHADRALQAHPPRTSRWRSIGTSPVPSLLPAMKQSDTWELNYKELTDYKHEHGDCNVPQSMGALGDWVFDQRISYTKGSLAKERVGRLDDIGFTWRFVETDGAAVLSKMRYWEELWDWRYRELKEYREKHGDCNVPQSQGPLGEWASWQRKNYKKGKLSDERIARLESVGFVWNPQEQQWSDRFDELTKYKAEEGDCNVQQSHGPLGEWVATQRKNYKKGDIADERIARLESIGFVWDQLEQQWSDRFDELTKYKARNGDCNVLQSQGPLGEWVVTQRKNYNKGDISDERIARLESIGFVWDPQEQQWSDRFDELAKYKAEQGDCNVPTYQGLLGEWVNTQRVSYKEGKMAQGRVDLLESVGFAWEPLDEAWMARFDELVDFKEENGDCNVPHAQGQLGKWVTTQRTSYKEEKLSQERIDFLENVGFEWVRMERTVTELPWKHDEQWKTKFTELVEYLIEHGSCHVPNRYGPLGWWVGTQRQDYKDGRMSQFRIDYLESIGFVWAMKRVGREAYPDQYSQPDPGAISRIVEEERPRHDDLPPSAPEALKARVNVGKRLAKALQEYLDNDSVRLIQTYEKPKKVDPRWKARYTELVHYLIEHGNCNVPRRFGPLGWWVGLQRQAYKEGSILQLRKEYLDSIGFVWTTKRVGGEWLPDEYSRPDPKTIARIIDDEKPRHEDLPSSAPKRLKMRVKADRDLVKALQEYLDKIETT